MYDMIFVSSFARGHDRAGIVRREKGQKLAWGAFEDIFVYRPDDNQVDDGGRYGIKSQAGIKVTPHN